MKINGEISITGKNIAKLPKEVQNIIANKVICLLKKHKKTTETEHNPKKR